MWVSTEVRGRWRTGVVTLATLGLLALTGCSDSPVDGGTAAGASSSGASTEPAGSTNQQISADPGCQAAKTRYAQMRATVAHWNPQTQPFDRQRASQVQNLADDLATLEGDTSRAAVRVELARNVTALNRLAAAMVRGNGVSQVLAAVRDTQVAHTALTATCSSTHHRDKPSTPVKTKPSNSAPAPALPRLSRTCKAAQAVMVKVGTVSAGWSPQSDPFNSAVARHFRALGDELAAVSRRGGSEAVRGAIQGSAASLTGLADSMGTGVRSRLNDALVRVQLAYAQTRAACSLP